MAEAEAIAATIELDLAWEFAPRKSSALPTWRATISPTTRRWPSRPACCSPVRRPHYFRRAGKGRFKKAPAEILQQALAAIEKKKLLQAQIDGWAEELAGHCPQPIREQLYKILFKPDKNAPEYKAVVEASRAAQLAPLDLLQTAGAIDSAYQFHWKRFLFDNFPKGTGFPPAPPPAAGRPAAGRCAGLFHRRLDDHRNRRCAVRAGPGQRHRHAGHPHCRAGLAIQPGGELDKLGRARLSTVYMPGYKITMLPDEVVQIYTLDEGRANPAVSLYVTSTRPRWSPGQRNPLERVPVVSTSATTSSTTSSPRNG
jgi:exoribonuclease-2